MKCPGFAVTEFGVFDSNVKFPKMKSTRERPVERYELEFFADPCQGQAYIDGQWFPMEQGWFICAKPGMVRKSILPFKCYYLHIETADTALCRLLDTIPVHGPMYAMQQIVGLFGQMLTAEATDFLLLGSCVCRIVHLLQQHNAAHANRRSSAHQQSLLEVEMYIRAHLSEELSLTALAALCSLSPTYFHSVFTEYFHRTPAQYILDCRIAAAKKGLLTGNYSLSELAADCGFSSQSYFCYKFKQVTGMTPMQYRKEQLGKLKI